MTTRHASMQKLYLRRHSAHKSYQFAKFNVAFAKFGVALWGGFAKFNVALWGVFAKFNVALFTRAKLVSILSTSHVKL